jgi:hypothetical protein
MSRLYSPERDFRDNGDTWYGRWSQNKNSACIGQGFGMDCEKAMYSEPVRERCMNGNTVVMIRLAPSPKGSPARPQGQGDAERDGPEGDA